MVDGAGFHETHGADAGRVRSCQVERTAVPDPGWSVGADGGPGGETAIRIKEIRRLVDLDMVFEHALRRITTGDRDRGVRQKQLHVVIEPGECVRAGGRE